MSRRKQSKPQQFGDNKNAPLLNETLSDAAGTIKQNLLPKLDDQNVTSEQTNELEAPFASSFQSCEVIASGEGTSAFTTNEATVNIPENKRLNEDFEVVRESVCLTRMASPGREEGIGNQQAVSADSMASRHGQFVPSHRNLLHPKYNGSFAAQRKHNGEAGGHNQEESRKTTQGEERSKQEGILSSSVGEERQAGIEFPPSEAAEEMYNCNSCENNFEQIGDYVRHKKFSCTSQASEVGMTYDERTTEEQKEDHAENSAPAGNYVISGNVIMANQGDLTMDIEEERPISHDKNGENVAEDDIDAERNLLQPDEPPAAEYGDERVETPNSIPDSESASTKNDSPFVRDDKLERPGSSDGQQNEEVKEATDETDKLRKELMATEAMAQAIQNMTTFASQTSGNSSEKPDIGAIRYQVRMIQQQQAYHVQMLNFLQWQLALASSSPQAAVAAAAAASSRGNGMTDGMSITPGMQPPFLAGAGCLPGGTLMPQMVAAMAMNNLHSSPNESNGMAELAKARFMMGMQQASGEGSQGIRSLFPSPMGDLEGVRRLDQEQRYQLKVADNDTDRAEINGDDTKGDESKSEMELTRTKSDSGFDEDARSSSANGEAKEDDACSSHGSQEDGELRDSILKSTAEEHRHKCRFCSKIFGSDSALQIHIRSHTGERPFKCNICGNRFTTKGNLKVHFTRHKSKYPHIPMNSQPVPEYLDHVPTSNGVPYGMSILPEKAVLERPRLHGNPSIHLSPQQAAAISQREVAPAQVFPNLFGHGVNGLTEKPENDFLRRPELAIPNGIGPADVASAIQAQLLQRRRAEYLEAQNLRQEEMSNAPENKNPMSILQAAMLPFLPSIAARQIDSVPPHLRYLLPHHLNQLNAQNGVSNDRNNNKMDLRLPTLQRSSSPLGTDGQTSNFRPIDKAVPNRQAATGSSSETTKLQRLVENIDRGRALQKNECHMCHRILSCQSALKLHYRTHTGERPYKCDLCSRAFTTRGNLRTHYSSVHRQQMRPLPPGGQRSTQSESFSCTLCSARFRDPVEFQHHMQMHAMVQAQQQQRMLDIEREKNNATAEGLDMTNSREKLQENGESRDQEVKREPESVDQEKGKPLDVEETDNEQHGDVDARETYSRSSSDSSFVDKRRLSDSIVKSEPFPSRAESAGSEASRDSNESASRTSPAANPLHSLAALSSGNGSDMPQHTGSMLDHQLAALSRARAGRLTVCEICEKPFSCQSALEIHLRTHTKERPFMCKICQRAFTTKGNLKQHLLTHNITDIPEQMLLPVSSPKNDNSASTTPSSSPTPNESVNSLNLKRPSDSIDQSEPSAKRTFPRHWCHICQKQFSSASSLQIHNRTHTGEKPFACNVCGRAFTTKGNLKVHMGTHVWGAGGSRRGRRISMDNPLISPWMKNMTTPRPPQPTMGLPTSGPMSDPSSLYQQYAALASGLLTAKQDTASRFLLPMGNGQNANSSSSPVSSSGSPHPPNEMGSPQNRVNMSNQAVSAATEWFLKAYQRTQEQVN